MFFTRALQLEAQLQKRSTVWIDFIKGTALCWIFLLHVVERVFGYPLISNPFSDWPAFGDRLAQLAPLTGYGLADLPVNLVRYVGWMGDQGVQLFLIVSGFGLVHSTLRRYGGGQFPLGKFYIRRLGRIYPMWWGVHILFLLTWFFWGKGLSPIDPNFYLSFAGIRITKDLIYYFSPSWWFVGLLLQLYLVFPLLWRSLCRLGAARFLLVALGISFAVRGLGLAMLDAHFDQYLDAWARGTIFITRLPEFAFGMALAVWLERYPLLTDKRLRSPSTLLLALTLYPIALALALTLAGMTVAPFLLGTCVFVGLYAGFGGIRSRMTVLNAPLRWLGLHSYSLFLVHHPIVNRLVPKGSTGGRAIGGGIAAVVVSVVLAIALEKAVDWVVLQLKRRVAQSGVRRTVRGLGAIALGVLALLVGGELLVRQMAPQEVNGWGERPSLAIHDTFGWYLKPSQTTHLRWESYDYKVTANSLGFPGSEYPEQKSPQSLRILVTGDAFTSAEGVDTNQSWARLLESRLSKRFPERKVEVLNFGMTGYGPNQHAAVVKEFAPRFRPDLILVEYFVNEYHDVTVTDQEFQQSIGFQLLDQNDWRFVADFSHLRRFIKLNFVDYWSARLRGKPAPPQGYFFGKFYMFERNRPGLLEARQKAAVRLAEIKQVADQIGAAVMVPMVPASIQVCQPNQLPYYPKNVDLSDTRKYDMELPQRMTQEITAELGIPYHDLRPALKTTADCPYQPRNKHWLVSGHVAVADYLTEVIAQQQMKEPVDLAVPTASAEARDLP